MATTIVSPDGILLQGWYPVLRFSTRSADNATVVQIMDWRGGSGNKPAVGFIKTDGTLTQNVNEAFHFAITATEGGGGGISLAAARNLIKPFAREGETVLIAKSDMASNSVGTDQIEEQAVTLDELSQSVQDAINAVEGSADASTFSISGNTISLSDNANIPNVTTVTIPTVTLPTLVTKLSAEAGTASVPKLWSVQRVWEAIRSAFSRYNDTDANALSYENRPRGSFAYDTSSAGLGILQSTGRSIQAGDETLKLTVGGDTQSVQIDDLPINSSGFDGNTDTSKVHSIQVNSVDFFLAKTAANEILAQPDEVAQGTIVFTVDGSRQKKPADPRSSEQWKYADIDFDPSSSATISAGTNGAVKIDATGSDGNQGLNQNQVDARITLWYSNLSILWSKIMASTIPAFASRWPSWNEVTNKPAQGTWDRGTALPAASTKNQGDKFNLSGVEYVVASTQSRNQLHITEIGTDGNYRGARKRTGVSDVGAFSDSALNNYQFYYYNSENTQGNAATIIGLPRSVIGGSPPSNLYVIVVGAGGSTVYLQLSRASGSDTSSAYFWQNTTGTQVEPGVTAPILVSFFASDYSTPMNVLSSSNKWLLDDADDKLNADAVDKRIEDDVEDWARDATTLIPAAKLTNAPTGSGGITQAAADARYAAIRRTNSRLSFSGAFTSAGNTTADRIISETEFDSSPALTISGSFTSGNSATTPYFISIPANRRATPFMIANTSSAWVRVVTSTIMGRGRSAANAANSVLLAPTQVCLVIVVRGTVLDCALLSTNITDELLLDAIQSTRTTADRGKSVSVSKTNQNDLVLSDLPVDARTTFEETFPGLTIAQTDTDVRPAAPRYLTPSFDLDDNEHGEFHAELNIRMTLVSDVNMSFARNTPNATAADRQRVLSNIFFASDLAEEGDFVFSSTAALAGLQVFQVPCYSANTEVGRYILLAVHNANNQVGFYHWFDGISGATGVTFVAELRVSFSSSDVPAASTGTTLNDDAVLDLFNETRGTGDRGRTLSVSSADENALAFSYRFQRLTQSAFDAATKDADTIYLIIG